jgi:6-pyruvoyltetrahydropterin/6-carboxytetrahydropterin synthase
MIRLTKIIRFETAHALHGYAGACRLVHGHSYKLEVTVGVPEAGNDFLPGTGILIDFKELKELIRLEVLLHFDHRLLLTKAGCEQLKISPLTEGLHIMEAEPSAENMLVFIAHALSDKLPVGIQLMRLKLFETADSYAEWLP